ncbi:MAG: transglutaminase domain-containing protein [Anaerolineae bacterium]
MGDVVARLFRWIIPSTTLRRGSGQGSGRRRRLEPRALLLLALLMLALGSVAHGLADVVRELDAGLLLTVATLGALVGWVMATTRLSGWLAGILASLLGAGVVLVRVGRLGGKLAAMVWAVVSLIGQICYWLLAEGWRLVLSCVEGLILSEGLENGGWRLAGPPPDWMTVSLALMELWADTVTLLDRGREWVLGLVGGNPNFDPVATALLWSLAMWAVAVWAGWAVRRHQPLQGIAPAGALLMATFSYTRAKPTALLTLLGTTLLLMAMVRHHARERRWQATRIDFSSDLWKDLTVTVALLSLALVVTAALVPSISVRRIVEFAQQLIEEQEDETELVAKSLGLETQPDPEKAASNEVRLAGMPRFHTISFRPQLSREVVMVVRTSDLRHDPRISRLARIDRDLSGPSEPPWRYYWRSIVYDHYTGHSWTTSQTEMVDYEAGEPVISEDMPFHRVLRQEVQVIGDLDEMLHVAGTLVTADQDFGVAWRSHQDTFATSSEATTYRADSLVPVISEEQLRSAGSDYPEWVKDRYLALPDQVPDRVLALARDLTATEPTPYDRALAIESYLRTFSYTLDVPSPPFSRDAADYFLFDLQRGHCDYYATTMAVLARAAGLPARLVLGYAGGTYDADNVCYLVTKADAHAWVEVYFPEYGWVEFEPTAGRPPIERQAEFLTIEWPEPEEPLQPAATERSRLAQFGWLEMLGVLALVPLVGIVWWAADIWRLRLLTPVAAVATLYQRLQHRGRRLGMPMREGNTPYEFATSFAEHFANLARSKYGWDTTMAPAVQEAQRLVGLYVQASYAPRPPNTDDQRQAIQTWRWLRRRLWMVWVLQRWWRSPLRRFIRTLNAGGLAYRR